MVYPSICDIGWTIKESAPSFYVDDYETYLRITGSFLIVFVDNIQNIYLLITIYNFNPNKHKQHVLNSFKLTIALITIILLLDWMAAITAIFSIHRNSKWILSPVAGLLGLHAILLDVLYKRFKALIVIGNENQQRFQLTPDDAMDSNRESIDHEASVTDEGSLNDFQTIAVVD